MFYLLLSDCLAKKSQRNKEAPDPICFSPSALEIPMVPPHPQFSNRSFIFDGKGSRDLFMEKGSRNSFDEKGSRGLNFGLNATTPPDPAPPDPPLLQGKSKVTLTPFGFTEPNQVHMDLSKNLVSTCRSYSTGLAGISSVMMRSHDPLSTSPLSLDGKNDSGDTGCGLSSSKHRATSKHMATTAPHDADARRESSV